MDGACTINYYKNGEFLKTDSENCRRGDVVEDIEDMKKEGFITGNTIFYLDGKIEYTCRAKSFDEIIAKVIFTPKD